MWWRLESSEHSTAGLFWTCLVFFLNEIFCFATVIQQPFYIHCSGQFVIASIDLVLFRFLAILDPRVGHTMDVLSPFISVLCHSDWLFHGESCPRIDVERGLPLVKSSRFTMFSCNCRTVHCHQLPTKRGPTNMAAKLIYF